MGGVGVCGSLSRYAVTFFPMRSWVHGWYYNPIFPGQYFYTISKR